MKNKFFSIFLLLFSLVSVYSCQIEEAPYKNPGGFGKRVTDDLRRTDTVKTENVQNVLVEDFTGWACGNCPQASEVVAKLEKNYGKRIISSKVHVTEIFAMPDGEYQFEDLRTPIGDELFAFSKGQALPNGMVNRRLINGRHLVYFTEWEKLSQEEIAKSPSAIIKIHNNVLNGADGALTLNTQIQLNYLQPGSMSDKLALYILEDSVIGAQKDYRNSTDPVKKKYAHMEVFRGAITGAWGEEVRLFATERRNTAPSANSKFAVEYNYQINPRWKAKHLSLVAVLHDDATKQVKQVAKCSFDNLRR